MAGIVASAVILASVAAAVPARADTAPPPPTAPSGRADAREMKARGLFARGRYAEALEIYVTLYAETAHPTYIRNIGRCYQNLGEADKAISTFREYLRQAKALTPPQRGEIEGYIREMEELKQKRESRGKEAAPTAARDEPAPAGPEPGASSRPPARKAVPAAAAASPPPSAVEARPARGGGAGGTVAPRKVAALATGAVGLAALGVGAYFGLRTLSRRQASDELCSSDPCGSMEGVRLNDEAKTSARLADIAIGVGVAAVGVATILLVTGPRPRAEASAAGLRLTPSIAASGRAAGLSLDGSW